MGSAHFGAPLSAKMRLHQYGIPYALAGKDNGLSSPFLGSMLALGFISEQTFLMIQVFPEINLFLPA